MDPEMDRSPRDMQGITEIYCVKNITKHRLIIHSLQVQLKPRELS